jgi:hypothetical protein
MELKNKTPIRLQEYCWQYRKRFGHLPSVAKLAWTADNIIIPNYRRTDLEKICKKMKWQIKTRKEITDYRRRQLPSVRIGKGALYLDR